jgi:asparagine synthase (glutamine-hydrolysing)
MCGITGYITNNSKADAGVIAGMVETLIHRGPEAGGMRVFSPTTGGLLALGHRRLSIIDLSSAGQQPMQSGDYTITFNGEIYNYKELQAELKKLGQSFVTNSDTEVILKAYAAWGTGCVDRFVGMFAFAIYDQQSEVLFCARDRAGVKPFYYYWDGDVFLFASELKAFLRHPEFKKELNLHAVSAFMQFGNVPTPHCIYKNSYKLKPAHTLCFDLRTTKQEVRCYWDVYDSYNQPKQTIGLQDAIKKTEAILSNAFEYRMVADVPVGIFLSGGYDSACLTALLQKDRNEKLSTYTIGVPDIGLNEAPYAREVARHLGTRHTEITCTEKEALELINDLPYFYDEPFADSSAIPTTLVCKMARQDVKVVLSADGGDEVFAGYNRYDYLIKYNGMLNAIPNGMRKALSKIMHHVPADTIPMLKRMYNFHNRYEKMKLLLRDPSAKNMMLSLSKQYDEQQNKDLFVDQVINMNTAYQSNELLKEFYTPLSYMMAVDYQTYLPDDILQKVDRASMSVSLEAREPFLDQHIVEWVATLPDQFKYHQGIKKYILREIVHQYIPKPLMDRPKMGFAIPINNWLSSNLREKVEYYLQESRIERQGIFKKEIVARMKKDFFSGKKELGSKIWYLLMFQMWHEKWMES